VRVRAWLIYSALRVLLFVAPFGILLLLGIDWLWAAVIAAVVGFCLSYVLLRGQRDRAALALAESRAAGPRRRSDELAEDDEA
jgi:hypothetical protein